MSAKVLRILSIILAGSMLLAACQSAATTQAPSVATRLK